MKPDQVLSYTIDKENRRINFFGKGNNVIQLHGSSLLTSIAPGTDDLHFFTIEGPSAGKSGLIALTVKIVDDRGHTVSYRPFFIQTWCFVNSEIKVFLETIWTPPAGYLTHVRDFRMEVIINDQLIASKPYNVYDRDLETKPLYTDGNKMCQYLASDITKEELLATIDECKKKEAALTQLPKLEARIDYLQGQLENADEELKRLHGIEDEVKDLELKLQVAKGNYEVSKLCNANLRDAIRSIYECMNGLHGLRLYLTPRPLSVKIIGFYKLCFETPKNGSQEK